MIFLWGTDQNPLFLNLISGHVFEIFYIIIWQSQRVCQSGVKASVN